MWSRLPRSRTCTRSLSVVRSIKTLQLDVRHSELDATLKQMLDFDTCGTYQALNPAVEVGQNGHRRAMSPNTAFEGMKMFSRVLRMYRWSLTSPSRSLAVLSNVNKIISEMEEDDNKTKEREKEATKRSIDFDKKSNILQLFHENHNFCSIRKSTTICDWILVSWNRMDHKNMLSPCQSPSPAQDQNAGSNIETKYPSQRSSLMIHENLARQRRSFTVFQ